MNYTEAVNYIENVPRFAKTSSLEKTRHLLHLLGDPDMGLKIIHVAGTNGKGSVCSYLESMLRTGGFRTGLFTSPHLEKMNERFMVDHVPVDDGIFLCAFERVKEAWEMDGDYHPTYFEILFLMAMVIFKELGVEAAVLETGLGGRLDATNAVQTAEACVITSISRDHMAVLGDSIADIASEKAGIMKPGVPCFYIDTNEEASAVMRRQAKETGCEAFPVKADYAGDRIVIISKGRYQKENAALSYFAMSHLPSFGLYEEEMLEGLKKASWPGRMEEALPGVFLDGAHNEDGIRRFVESAAQIAGNERPMLLFSAVRDKEYKKMAEELAQGIRPACVITTEVSSERAASAEDLADVFKGAGCENVTPVKPAGAALRTALQERNGKLLFCVGSLYLIGELKKELSNAEL